MEAYGYDFQHFLSWNVPIAIQIVHWESPFEFLFQLASRSDTQSAQKLSNRHQIGSIDLNQLNNYSSPKKGWLDNFFLTGNQLFRRNLHQKFEIRVRQICSHLRRERNFRKFFWIHQSSSDLWGSLSKILCTFWRQEINSKLICGPADHQIVFENPRVTILGFLLP